MKVSIDPVETFFSGISSTWGRALAFFGTCWVSFGFGLLCSNFSWGPGHSFDLDLPRLGDLYLLPFVWICSVPGICLERWQWGVPHGIFLLGAFYVVMFLETDLFRSMLVLSIVESWHAFICDTTEGTIYDFGSFLRFFIEPPWHVLLPFMLLMNAYAAWHVYDSWRNDRRDPMPP